MDQVKEKCERFKKEFTSKLYLKQHAAESARGKPYLGEVCNKKSTQKRELEYHRLTHGRKSTPKGTLPPIDHSEVPQSSFSLSVAQGKCVETSVDEIILQMRDQINKDFEHLQLTQVGNREMSAIQSFNAQVDNFKSVAFYAQKSADIAILMASTYKERAAAARKDVNDRKCNSLYCNSSILKDALNELIHSADYFEKEAVRLQMDADWKVEQASVAKTNAETACKHNMN